MLFSLLENTLQAKQDLTRVMGKRFGFCEMHQVVGSHDCNGTGSDHQPLEDIWVKLPSLTAATIQTLHCITQQGLVLMKQDQEI